jgi:hypothetical protein
MTDSRVATAGGDIGRRLFRVELDGVDGRRPYCTASGVGAALAV